MQLHYELELFDPCPLAGQGVLEPENQTQQDLIALNIECKYLFLDEAGDIFHQYYLPLNKDMQNLGGYVDKVVKYRDPELYDYLKTHGVSPASFNSEAFPLLRTRSPQLDLLLLDLIRYLRAEFGLERVSLFDHGCTVAEHYDLLDVMLRASSGEKESGPAILSYFGLDKSPMLLTVAKFLHPEVPPEYFRLLEADGSQFSLPPASFDLSLSVGVVNHVADALQGLKRLISVTRYACVLAIWVTLEEEGFWAINHSGVSTYFFSRQDLLALQGLHPGGRFLVADFIPELDSTQPRSYVGLGLDRLAQLGCYHLVYTPLPQPPFNLAKLE